MKRIINFRDFNVFSVEKEVWDVAYHNHNFYELIVIEAGSGKHRLNDITFAYTEGDVFLLRPSDEHEFEIDQKTKFIYIKFTEGYVNEVLLPGKSNKVKTVIQLLMMGQAVAYKSGIQQQPDRAHFLQLAGLLLHEHQNKTSNNNEVAASLFFSMILLLTRNLIDNGPEQKWMLNGQDKIESILAYINIYALEAAKMKIDNMAEVFLLSPNYISVYVKKETGFSVQQHVVQHKINAAVKLLALSNYTINEIADKLGFLDNSHFNKLFKKYTGMAPLLYRKNHSAAKI